MESVLLTHGIGDESNAVQVFHFTANTPWLTNAMHGDIYIAPERAFLHVPIGCTHSSQSVTKLAYVCAYLIRGAEIRTTDNLNECGATSV